MAALHAPYTSPNALTQLPPPLDRAAGGGGLPRRAPEAGARPWWVQNEHGGR